MTLPLVLLSRDHAGKPGRPDGGAAADLDGDGVVEVLEQEARLTPRYLLAAEVALVANGYEVIVLSDGSYGDRHARANSYASSAGRPTIYVAAHLNAGGGDYGAVFYDARSSAANGPALASCLAESLATLPELARARALPAKTGDWTRRALTTIGGLGLPIGICFEPCFVDTDAHRPLLTAAGLESIGRALAGGIHAWAMERA